MIQEPRVLETPYLKLASRHLTLYTCVLEKVPIGIFLGAWKGSKGKVIRLPFKLRIFFLETQRPPCWPPAACYLPCTLFGGWDDYSLNISVQFFQHSLSSWNATNELPWGVGTGPQPAGANYFLKISKQIRSVFHKFLAKTPQKVAQPAFAASTSLT